jgi:hypothetical protein
MEFAVPVTTRPLSASSAVSGMHGEMLPLWSRRLPRHSM